MIQIVKGNDAPIEWRVSLNGLPLNLTGKAVSLYVINSRGPFQMKDFKVKGNVVTCTYYGADQTRFGAHSLILRLNEGLPEMSTVAVKEAFELVEWSKDQGGESGEPIKVTPVIIEADVAIAQSGGGGGDIDLSAYLTKIEAGTTFQPKGDYATAAELTELSAEMSGKQETLVSGQNIKTINGQSVLGEGEITIIGDSSVNPFTDNECRQAFIQRMNEKAAEIGMHDTIFTDPTGRENISTAHDMCRCLLHASGYERLQEIWATPEHEMTFIQEDGTIRHSVITNGLINGAFDGSYHPVGGKGGSLNPGRVMPDGNILTNYVSNMSCILQSIKNPEDFYAITTMGYYADKTTAYAEKIQAIKDVMALIEAGATEPQDSRLDEVIYEGKTYRDIFINGNYAPNINGGDYNKSVNGKKTYYINSSAIDSPTIVESEESTPNYVPPHAFAIDSAKSLNLTTARNADTKGSNYFAACSISITRYTAGRLGLGIGTKDWVAKESITDGYEVVSGVIEPTATSAGSVVFYIGSANNADLAGMVNNPVIINMNMFSTAPSEEQLTTMYNEFCNILREDYSSGSSGTTSPNADYICAFKLPKYNARAYKAIELTPVYSKRPTTQFYPASMSKMMTAMLALDFLPDIYEKVTLKQSDIDAFPTPNWYAKDILLGETLTICDVLYIMMMPSSNIATEILSRVVGERILRSRNKVNESNYITNALNTEV